MKRRIGIFGGMFNPIHHGHLISAQVFYEQLKLDSVNFVPASVSPFKVSHTLEVANYQRLNMVQQCIRKYSHFKVSDYEIRKKGVSYTVDTLEHFAKKYQDSELFLLVGSDQLNSFSKWKEWKRILELSILCVAQRPGDEIDASALKEIRSIGTVEIVNSPMIQISSTNIRHRIKQKLPIRPFVTERVAQYIKSHQLYKGIANE